VESRLSPGRQGLIIDGYQLIVQRTDQGLGDAWLAQRPHDASEQFVVKFVSPVEGSAPSTAVVDALTKAERTGASGLVNLRRWGVTEGWLHVAHEFIEARPLSDWIAGCHDATTPPPPSVALWLFDRLCGAVHSAHRQSVIHGAISPRSVLVRALSPGLYHGWVLDLALGDSLRDAALVSTLEAPPTAYLAPEQLAQKGNITPATDVFALALLLVEMLTLTAAPHGNPREPIARFVEHDHARLPALLHNLRDDVHDEFWTVLSEALHPSAERRPQSVQSLKGRVREAARAAGLWEEVPRAFAEPPPPTKAATADAHAQRGRATAPDGWQHSERMRVDHAEIRAMVASVERVAPTVSVSASAPAPAAVPSVVQQERISAPSNVVVPTVTEPAHPAPRGAIGALGSVQLQSPEASKPIRHSFLEPVQHTVQTSIAIDDFSSQDVFSEEENLEGTIRRTALVLPSEQGHSDGDVALPSDQPLDSHATLRAIPRSSIQGLPQTIDYDGNLTLELGAVRELIPSDGSTDATVRPPRSPTIPPPRRPSTPSPSPFEEVTLSGNDELQHRVTYSPQHVIGAVPSKPFVIVPPGGVPSQRSLKHIWWMITLGIFALVVAILAVLLVGSTSNS
jgi:hypothetical protein